MNNLQIREELVRRFDEDQEFFRQKAWAILEQVCAQNALWLKEVISVLGWPDKQKVGEKGEQAAWLIVQHASDINLQEQCLQYLQHLPQTQERLEYIAYLTDRMLVIKGEQQVYGTQFHYGAPFPIINQKDLDKRRQQMGLEPFNKYYQRMKFLQ